MTTRLTDQQRKYDVEDTALITAFLRSNNWAVGEHVTVAGAPTVGDTLVADYRNGEQECGEIVGISVNILTIKLGDKVLRLAPLNPSETAAMQAQSGKKPMIVWVVQP